MLTEQNQALMDFDEQIKEKQAEADEAFNNGRLYHWFCCLFEIANLKVMKRQAERK